MLTPDVWDFVGRANVMMAFANNDRLDDAKRVAIDLNQWLDETHTRNMDGVPPEFSQAKGEVAAILKYW